MTIHKLANGKAISVTNKDLADYHQRQADKVARRRELAEARAETLATIERASGDLEFKKKMPHTVDRDACIEILKSTVARCRAELHGIDGELYRLSV